jgi:hypothetical protein
MSLNVYLINEEGRQPSVVFQADITYDLRMMAMAVSIYDALWHPADVDIVVAKDLLISLSTALKVLLDSREMFEKYNPARNTGNYNTLVTFVSKYLTACIQYPDATIKVD